MKKVSAVVGSQSVSNELKHINEHLERHERNIEEFDGMPEQRMQQLITAVIAALAGGLILQS